MPTAQSEFATVKVGGTVISDSGAEVNLNEGDNTVTVTVIAEDGTEKEYSLNIHRATAAEELDASLDGVTVNGNAAEKNSETEFTASVAANAKTVTIVPSAHEVYYATVKVNGENLDDKGAAVLDMSGDELNAAITVECRGITKNYTLTVTREKVKYIDVSDSFKNKLTIEKSCDENGVTLTITPTENNSLPALKLYTAVYNSDKTLKGVSADDCEINDGKAVLTLKEPTIDSGEKYKIFLWTNEQIPVIQTISNQTAGFFE
jgi:hypothetical protein